MTPNEYQKLAMRTCNLLYSPLDDMACHAVFGLTSEAGEVAGLATRELWKQIPQDADRWLEELGDVLWYVTAAAACRGYTLEDLYNYNVKKLEERYGRHG